MKISDLIRILKFIAHEMILGVCLIPVFICLFIFYIVYLFFYIYPRITIDAGKYIFTGRPTARFDAYMEKSKYGIVKYEYKKSIVNRKHNKLRR